MKTFCPCDTHMLTVCVNSDMSAHRTRTDAFKYSPCTASNNKRRSSASLQVYKRAKALDQSDNDISAVYRAYIH